MEKLAGNLPGIHDVNSLSSTGRRSIPPSPGSAFLDLFMHEKAKERLAQEKARLQRREGQISKNTATVNKRIAYLLKIATKRLSKTGTEEAFSRSGNHTVLGY